MAQGYTRQSTANIVNGAVIDALYLNNEFDQITAFANAVSGHIHDGTTGNGGRIAFSNISGVVPVSAGGTGQSAAGFTTSGQLLISPSAGNLSVYTISTGLKISGSVMEHNMTGSGAVIISGAQIRVAVSAPLAVSGSSLQLNYASTLTVSGGLLDVVAVTLSAATQAEMNTGTATTVYANPATSIAADWQNARNYVTNPEGFIFQRAVPTTDNAYAWDRWRLLLGAANAATVSSLTTGLPTGIKNGMRLTVGSGNNNKFGIFQILEGANIYALRGKTICLSAYIKSTAALDDIRMAIVEWTGTEDATSGDPISAWNTAATVPTYNTGWANLNTPADLGVTTSFVRYSVTATVGSSATNLAVFIWNEDTSSTQTTDILDVTGVMLTLGGAASAYTARNYTDELLLCQRYCYATGAVLDGNSSTYGAGQVVSTTAARINMTFPVQMFAEPTLVVENAGSFRVLNAALQSAPSGGIALYVAGKKAAIIECTTAAVMTAGQGAVLMGSGADHKLTFSAEL